MCKGKSKDSAGYAIEELKPSNMLGKLTTWALIWPFSMVENVLGDFIKIIQTFITKFFRGIYNRIYMSAVGKLMPEVAEEKNAVPKDGF